MTSTMLLPFSTSGSGGGDAMEAARAKEAKEAKEAVHVRQLRIAPDGSVAAVGFQSTHPSCGQINTLSRLSDFHFAMFESTVEIDLALVSLFCLIIALFCFLQMVPFASTRCMVRLNTAWSSRLISATRTRPSSISPSRSTARSVHPWRPNHHHDLNPCAFNALI